MTKTIRPPVKWHGGKYYMWKRIVEQFPAHKIYVEPFGGAASVLLNKQPSEVEVYNDLDSRLVGLFEVLQDDPNEFIRCLSLMPYSEEVFKRSLTPIKSPVLAEFSAWFYVQCRQSLGGRGDSFSYSITKSRRGMAQVVSGWLSSIDDNLPLVIERFREVQIMNRPAIEIIEKFDSPDTLFYCDPPYVHSTRVSEAVYGHELGDWQHADLFKVLNNCNGKIVVSGYRCELYDSLYQDWRTVEFDMPNNAAGGKTKARKTETLWMNW